MQTFMTDVLGTIGSLMLAVCSVPAAYAAWKDKKCTYNKYFLLLWFWGEAALLAYVLLTKHWLLLPNYLVNLVAIGIIWRYND